MVISILKFKKFDFKFNINHSSWKLHVYRSPWLCENFVTHWHKWNVNLAEYVMSVEWNDGRDRLEIGKLWNVRLEITENFQFIEVLWTTITLFYHPSGHKSAWMTVNVQWAYVSIHRGVIRWQIPLTYKGIADVLPSLLIGRNVTVYKKILCTYDIHQQHSRQQINWNTGVTISLILITS